MKIISSIERAFIKIPWIFYTTIEINYDQPIPEYQRSNFPTKFFQFYKRLDQGNNRCRPIKRLVNIARGFLWANRRFREFRSFFHPPPSPFPRFTVDERNIPAIFRGKALPKRTPSSTFFSLDFTTVCRWKTSDRRSDRSVSSLATEISFDNREMALFQPVIRAFRSIDSYACCLFLFFLFSFLFSSSVYSRLPLHVTQQLFLSSISTQNLISDRLVTTINSARIAYDGIKLSTS